MNRPLILSLIFGLCAAAGPGTPAASEESAPRPVCSDGSLAGYRLAWHDEFTGDALDLKQWEYRTGQRYWSVSQPQNISVSDGRLKIELKKEKVGKAEYTAGGVISRKPFKYGYYEARFKCPPHAGWHTSFWTHSHDFDVEGADQELDICEQDSINPHGYSVNVHQWKPAHKGLGAKGIQTPDLSADFHVYGCEMTPAEIRFYFDGRLVGTKDVSKLKLDEQQIWLTSIASPLGHTRKVDEEHLPAYAEYDWVRFYEKPHAGGKE